MTVPDPFANLEPDNDAILKAAAALIRAHKYSDARNLLNSIPGNPTAKTWLEKLSDPRYQTASAQPTGQTAKIGTANSVGPMYKAAMIVVVIAVWFILLLVVWPALLRNVPQTLLFPVLCLLPAIVVVVYQIVTKRRWPWY